MLLFFSFYIMCFVRLTSCAQLYDEEFGASLDECITFASKFENTCDSQTVQLAYLSEVPRVEVNCSCWNSKRNEYNCKWDRQLCVTCTQETSSPVMIRVLSNGLPNHCF